MQLSLIPRLMLTAALCVASQQSVAADGERLARGYKAVDGKVVFQVAMNIAPVVLEGANPADFSVLASSNYSNVVRSNGRYYCNARPLPEGTDIASASISEYFLLSNTVSLVSCEPLSFPVDRASFRELDFPYFADKTHVFTVTGELLPKADPATFQTLASNQAKDKAHYFFDAHESIVLPYKKSAEAYPPCYGWAKIDGQIYYEGKPYADVDLASLRCLNFMNAVDKAGFFVYSKREASLPGDANVSQIKSLAKNVFTDNRYVWFADGDVERLEGLNPARVTVSKGDEAVVIRDGKQGWSCSVWQSSSRDRCERVTSSDK